ncbi:MAG: UDP-N-acetylmuramoyl-L-alanine--D-glutamate ligase [Dokdonella sp.]|uniref:UDP-N-acetylmuramoyl-L-alanine--D-glutamate ligase n=1 Tax=Dokdonella sp. TaxID=2291710 RepID=UPI003267478F
MRIAELAGRTVAVWGLGREGRAALAALHARAPELMPTLFCSEEEARLFGIEETSRLTPLAPKPGNSVVGDGGSGFSRDAVHIETDPPDGAALSAFDLVIKSPGISAYRAEILEARHNGTHFTSGTALWFAEHPQSRVIAVTGTKGKSTVSALIAHLLRSLGRRVALAGNIGLPLLELLDPPQEPDWWVIELSSFQTRDAGAVEVGIVNNLYEEHLDWHGSRERYAEDKLTLANASRTLVVNALQPELQSRLAAHPRLFPFGTAAGWHVSDGAVMRGSTRVFEIDESPLPGLHNAMNACAALAAIEAAGEDAIGAAAAIGSFNPLPHRLQMLGERDGRVFVDDSIATTPQATLEALASFGDRPVTVLVGGYDRGLDWRPFVQAMREAPPHAIVTMGANGERIRASLNLAGGNHRLESAATLEDALPLAIAATPIGGVVLLSPGAPSFDQFKDYVERGCAFARMAGFDPATIGMIDGLGIA